MTFDFQNQELKTNFLEAMKRRFNVKELKDLCLTLDVDYEDVPGSTKGGKIRELIEYKERRGELMSLFREVLCIRRDYDSDFSWKDDLALDDDVYKQFSQTLWSTSAEWEIEITLPITVSAYLEMLTKKQKEENLELGIRASLEELCYTMGVRYRSLPGNSFDQERKIYELIRFLECEKKILEFLGEIKETSEQHNLSIDLQELLNLKEVNYKKLCEKIKPSLDSYNSNQKLPSNKDNKGKVSKCDKYKKYRNVSKRTSCPAWLKEFNFVQNPFTYSAFVAEHDPFWQIVELDSFFQQPHQYELLKGSLYEPGFRYIFGGGKTSLRLKIKEDHDRSFSMYGEVVSDEKTSRILTVEYLDSVHHNSLGDHLKEIITLILCELKISQPTDADDMINKLDELASVPDILGMLNKVLFLAYEKSQIEGVCILVDNVATGSTTDIDHIIPLVTNNDLLTGEGIILKVFLPGLPYYYRSQLCFDKFPSYTIEWNLDSMKQLLSRRIKQCLDMRTVEEAEKTDFLAHLQDVFRHYGCRESCLVEMLHRGVEANHPRALLHQGFRVFSEIQEKYERLF